MQAMKKPRIGIIGTGLIAVSHAQGIMACGQDCEITALCDNEPGKAGQFAAVLKIPGAKLFEDYKELVDSGLCDMVSICTPNHMHKPIFLYAAQKGMAILCEKPIGLNKAEVEEMAKAAEQYGIVNLSGFTYRRIPAVLEMKKLIDKGMLGQIRHFRGRMYADRMAAVEHPLEWRHLEEKAGSGVLGDLASHALDMGMFLLGEQCGHIRKVFGEMSIRVPERKDPKTGQMVKVTCDDVCNIIGKFDSGCDVVIETSRHFPFDFEVVISGEKGVVRYSLTDYNNLTLMLYDSPADYFKQYRVIPVKTPGTPLAPEPGDRMARQYRYLIGCLAGGEEAHPTVGETREIAHLLDVIKLSAQKEEVMKV